MGLIHVLMLSRAIEAQVTVEELCDLMRQLAADEGDPSEPGAARAHDVDSIEPDDRPRIPRVDFW